MLKQCRRAHSILAGATLALLPAFAHAQAPAAVPPAAPPVKDTLGYQDTPLLPGGRWHVHDGLRPQPAIVNPGSTSTMYSPGRPPADALVLFDGTGASLAAHWRNDKGQPVAWKYDNGAMISVKGGGYAFTREEFGNCQLHVEWAAPTPPQGKSQGRGNSGVFLCGVYEVQVLDSFGNETYPDGQAAAIYGQAPPLVNAARPAGDWQTYDIIFTAPRWRADKTLAAPAYITVLHNGVLVQNHTQILGDTGHRIDPHYIFHGATGPLALQDHGNPVRYRNIWVRPLPAPNAP